jgi:DUF971 family protein
MQEHQPEGLPHDMLLVSSPSATARFPGERLRQGVCEVEKRLYVLPSRGKVLDFHRP